MSEQPSQRRLAAIMVADVVGYSRLMGEDETGTLAKIKAIRFELLDPIIAKYRGRVVKTTGDGLLAEFLSVVEAVGCALTIQRAMSERTAETIQLRIGINVGDVIVEDGDVFGDGVNVVARIESLAPPGGLAITETVREHLGTKLNLHFRDLGERSLKNIERSVRVLVLADAGQTNRNPVDGSHDPPGDEPSCCAIVACWH